MSSSNSQMRHKKKEKKSGFARALGSRRRKVQEKRETTPPLSIFLSALASRASKFRSFAFVRRSHRITHRACERKLEIS